jgi:hypothetical protein
MWHGHTPALGSKTEPEGHGSGRHAFDGGLQNWPSSHGAELAVGVVVAAIGINAITAISAMRQTHFFTCLASLKGYV